MKKLVLAAFVFAAAYAPAASIATEKSDMYFDIGVASINTSVSDTGLASASSGARFPSVGFSNSALRATFGKKINKHLDVEVMTLMGLSESTDHSYIGNLPFTASMKLEPSFGLYLKPKFKVNDAIEAFARVGYFRGNYSATVNAKGLSWSDSGGENDISVGYGMRISLTKNASLTFDHMRYQHKADVRTDGNAIGLTFNF